jgi:Zn-dependent protease
MQDIFIILFQILILLFSLVIHEVAHGTTSLALGDDTAKRAGRL